MGDSESRQPREVGRPSTQPGGALYYDVPIEEQKTEDQKREQQNKQKNEKRGREAGKNYGVLKPTKDPRNDILRRVFEGQPIAGCVKKIGRFFRVAKFFANDKLASVEQTGMPKCETR